jgi:D-alanyl-D-alanine carboxypeptidase (penicillin-binding protein 5/6)
MKHASSKSKWCAAAVLACVAATAFAAPNPVSGPKPADGGFQTAAPHAILIDAESGSVLFEKGADNLIPPASLSKLMTAEVVFNEIKQGRLKPTTEFIVSTAAWRRGGAPSRTSACSSRASSGQVTISCTASSSSPPMTPASYWRKGSRAPSPPLPS